MSNVENIFYLRKVGRCVIKIITIFATFSGRYRLMYSYPASLPSGAISRHISSLWKYKLK